MPKKTQISDEILRNAVYCLRRWEEGASLESCLNTASPKFRRTLGDLLRAYFRYRVPVTTLLAKFAKKRPAAVLRRILECASVQILFQDGIPAEAACNCAVDLARKNGGKRAAGFVNAVLRRIVGISKSPESVLFETPAELFPEKLRARWASSFGEEELERFAELLMLPAPVTFRLRNDIPDSELRERRCVPLPENGPWKGLRFYISEKPGSLFRSGWLKKGLIYIQDPATCLSVKLLDPQPGETVADLCAAPGGKALQLAGRIEDGHLVAADRSPGRLKRVSMNFANTKFSVSLVSADLLAPPFAEKCFDAVLLDVPCSNTGVFRHKPDVLWRFSDERLSDLCALQRRLLSKAAELVKPGGRIVYSTCSIESAENESQIDWFLEEKKEDFSLLEEKQLLPCSLHDGAYAALMLRS